MTTSANTDIQNHDMRAWVVFSSHADLYWLKILKPGFRHCAVLLNDGAHWITLDPLSNYTDIVVHQVPQEFDLPLWMQDRGHTVIAVPVLRPLKPAPLALYSCVEVVKRLLGIQNRFIFTPWQLYRHLTNTKTNTLLKGEFAWEV